MSDIFQEALMEDAARIDVSPMTWKQVKESCKYLPVRIKWKQRLIICAGMAALAFMGIIGLGFCSSTIAKSLQNIPIIGQFYTFKNPALARYSSQADSVATDKGITVYVSRVYYDGNELDIIYVIHVPTWYKPSKGTQFAGTQPAIPFLKSTLSGKPLRSVSAGAEDSLVSTDTYRGHLWFLLAPGQSRNGMLVIPIRQIGAVKGSWTLSFPVSSTTTKFTRTILPQNASTTSQGFTLSVEKVTIGPAYTYVFMELKEALQAHDEPFSVTSFKREFCNTFMPGYWPTHDSKVKPSLICIAFRVSDAIGHYVPGGWLINRVRLEKVGKSAVWHVRIRCRTPSSNIRSISIKPILFGRPESEIPIPQLTVTVSLN